MQKYPGSVLNDRMQPASSIPAQRAGQSLDIQNDMKFEKSIYAPPTMISKGSINTIAGGILTLYDKTGGTALFTYNPATGVITIQGSLVANQVNTGTYTSITLAGQNNVLGTMQNGVYGTAQYTGGTANLAAYQTGGTAGISGSIVYVKTINFAGSTTTLGTLSYTNGLITNSA